MLAAPLVRSLSDHEELALLLQHEVVDTGTAPAAVAGFCLATERGAGCVAAAGTATTQSVFDLASLSKTCIALTTSLLVTAGELAWNAPVGRYLDWLADTPGAAGTVAQHLSHRAGMQAHGEFFVPQQAGAVVSRKRFLREVASARRADQNGGPLYSDLGYMLVGAVLEQLSCGPLDELIRQVLTAPCQLAIGSARQWCAADPSFHARVAATEVVTARGGQIAGLVHDDNAWALSGTACAGHAGLFGTTEAVLELGRLLLAGSRGQGPLAEAAAPLLERRPGGTLRLGLDGPSGAGSMAGAGAGPETFGHLGFTGTSFWCDPARQAVGVLLCNRVCPTRNNTKIRQARPRVHDHLWRLAEAFRACEK